MKKKAVILLHEIYGVNAFVKEQAHDLQNQGFDVDIPDLLSGLSFGYEEESQAYSSFVQKVGFGPHPLICERILKFQETHEKVFLVGFSVGATLAWQISSCISTDGMVGFYGSRIRDFTELSPLCPALLLFSRGENFEKKLKGEQLQVEKMDQPHGFMDRYSPHYSAEGAKKGRELMLAFLQQKSREK